MITPLILNCNDEYWLPYVLESSRGFFTRYVIYDVGSTDNSKRIIQWFVNSMRNKAEFFVRSLDYIPHPKIQGIFRNSMIAEARSEWYLILDSDEIYTPEGYTSIVESVDIMNRVHENSRKIYGIVPRVEVTGDLQSAYGLNSCVPHHRIYHRTAVWTGPHPGEVALYPQNDNSQIWLDNITCYHFHNAVRSHKDAEVPKRLERRNRGTYKPGETASIDLLNILPILQQPVQDFPVNPELSRLQENDKM